MQRLTDAPREDFTEAQVTGLLTGGSVAWGFGAELLTTAGPVDISDDLVGGSVAWNGDQDVHRSCQIGLSRELAWGRDQIMLFCAARDLDSAGTSSSSILTTEDTFSDTFSDTFLGTLTTVTVLTTVPPCRFNMGVFVLATPKHKEVGQTPATWDVTGEDLLALLVQPIGDTYTVTAGTGYLAAVRALISAAAPGAPILLDSTAEAKVLPDDMVWALTESEQPTRLRITNDLLKALGYIPVWVDQDGNFRSSPSVTDDTRPDEWAFDADDELLGIVGQERTLTVDVWTAPNAWRFVASGLGFPPEEGNGMYTPAVYQSGGPSSIDALGKQNLKVKFLDAADQDALVAQADVIVAADKRVGFQLDMTSYPFPLAGHRDIATYTDAALGGTRKVVAKSWSFDLSQPGQPPADTSWVWEMA